jgi:general nucleoside transport system ATP-binding protein
LRTMAAGGKSVIFISHKLHEVMSIADRISVLRKGRVTAAGILTAQTSREELAHQMVGRDVIFHLEKTAHQIGRSVLIVEDIHAENDKGLPALRGVSFEVHAGEILGLAGVAGNGQSELAQVISGLRKCTQGCVTLNGEPICNLSTLTGIQKGLAYIPEDRNHVGSSPNLSVTDNLIMKKYRLPPISRGWGIDMNTAVQYSNDLKKAYDIIVPSVKTPVRLLSGGNLQRVILAREISGEPIFLLAVQPTRGLDVGAIEGIQRLLLAQRNAGAAILLISEELEELISLSDRMIVLYEGRVMGEMVEPDLQTIGMMMTGTPLEEIHPEGWSQHG